MTDNNKDTTRKISLKKLPLILLPLVIICVITIYAVYQFYQSRNPDVKTTVTPTVTKVVSTTPTKVTMPEFNAEITIPAGWTYTKTENVTSESSNTYAFIDQYDNQIFFLGSFDGGILENYCRTGQLRPNTVQVAGKNETIQSCYVGGKFARTYSQIDENRFVFDSDYPLTDQIKTILNSITNTGAKPN